MIDMDALTLHPAAMAWDLPAGGNRILQGQADTRRRSSVEP